MIYIFQIIVYQLLFLMVYDLLLKRETFFNTNRWYLIGSVLLSFFLPLIKVDFFKQFTANTTPIFELPEVIINNAATPLVSNIEENTSLFSGLSIAYGIWLIGFLVFLFLFLKKIKKLHDIKKTGTVISSEAITIVSLPNTSTGFSFMNTIYIGDSLSEQQRETILQHERIHINERHSFDLLFFELLKIFFWFNPITYILQNRLVVLQEYIVDQKMIMYKNRSSYYQSLLSEVFQTDGISFINTFFNHSLIKKRIIMLQKTKSKKIVQLKYLVVIPVIYGMLFLSACSEHANGQEMTQSNSKESSDIIKNIEALKESIAAKGNMTKEEKESLKVLMALTADSGISDPQFKDITHLIEIPFGVVDQVPAYPGCEGADNKSLQACLAKNIQELFMKEFNTKLANDLDLSGNIKIMTSFKIDANGNVTDIKAKNEHASLRDEAIRVLSKIPAMKPAMHDGVAVAVPYVQPIVFAIE